MVRKSTRAASVVLACAAAVSATVGVASAAQTPATPGVLCSTASTLEIAGLAFQPPAVAPGQTSTATAAIANCTNQAQQGTAQWVGRFVSASGTGLPAGCPVIDPIAFPVNVPAHGSVSSSVGYLVPSSCTATGLIVTVQVSQQGKVVAQRSAELTIIRPTP
jgi:hypothetical protein